MDAKRRSPEKRLSPSKRLSKRKISSNMAVDSTASTAAQEEKLKELGLKKIWLNAMRDYDLTQQLGQGSFGLVYEGKCRVTGRVVAIKLIHNFSQYEYDCVKVIREIQIMRGLHQTAKSGVCCFIPELLDLIIPDEEDESNLKNIFLIMEYEQSDLRQLLKLGLSSKLTEEHVKLIMYNLLCAFKYLHSANVLHRDIKPSNILINKDCQIKICDFGLSRTLPDSCIGSGSGNSRRIRESISKNKLHKNFTNEEIRQVIAMKLEDRKKEMNTKKRSLSSHVGSRWYRPPEITLIMKQYDSASDLWSLGCCLFELMKVTGHHPETAEPAVAPSSKKLTQIMFPGECCYPLSPKTNKKDGTQDDQILQERDQLRITIDKIKKIDESDLAFVTHEEARNYVQVLQEKSMSATKRKHFLEEVPSSSTELKDILENLIQLNPYFRWTPSELLKLPFFNDLRIPDLEKSAPQKLKLEVDSDQAFDYENGVSKQYTKKDYIAIIVKEANFVHKSRRAYLQKAQEK